MTSPAELLHLAAVWLGGYLIGSIPFGVLVMRLAGAGDPRAIGSGNIGATNVLRSGRKGLALLTLLGDGAKGAVAVLIGRHLGHEYATAYAGIVGATAGVGAFLGHLFPVWLGLRGGKGVATFFGVMFAAAWPVGIACALVWLAVAAALRFSLCLVFRAPVELMWMSLALAILVFVRHAANIARLRAGTEPRIGAKTATAADPAA